MRVIFLASNYAVWHYTRGIHDVFIVWKNILWFIKEFFSINLLFKTFFKPWKRLQEKHYRSEGVSEFISNIIVNTLMRIVGIIIRSVVIITGLIFLIIYSLSGIFFFGFWFLLPILSLFLFITGVITITKSII